MGPDVPAEQRHGAQRVTWLYRGSEALCPVTVARTLRQRARGLLGRDGIDGALLLRPASWVHTLGMRFTLDVVHLDRDLQVLRVLTMPPQRMGRPVPVPAPCSRRGPGPWPRCVPATACACTPGDRPRRAGGAGGRAQRRPGRWRAGQSSAPRTVAASLRGHHTCRPRSSAITPAALNPGLPVKLPPGCWLDPHRYSPSTGVR